MTSETARGRATRTMPATAFEMLLPRPVWVVVAVGMAAARVAPHLGHGAPLRARDERLRRAATPRPSRYAAGGADRDGWHAA